MARAQRLEFPLLTRELTRTGRQRLPYVLRLGPVGLALPFLGLLFLGGGLNIEYEDAVVAFLRLPRVFQLVFVFGLTPLVAAGIIADERRARTFDLLLLADLRGGDLYLAKLASAFGQVMMLLLSTLPLLAIGSIMGGISVPVEATRLLALSACALAICTVGLMFSTAFHTPLDALLGTFGALTLAVVLPIPFNGAGATLFGLIRMIDSGSGWFLVWLPITIVALTIAAVCAGVTVYILPRSLSMSPRAKPARKRRRSSLWRRLVRPHEIARLAGAMLSDSLTSGAGRVWRYVVGIALVPVGMLMGYGGVGVAMLTAIAVFDTTSEVGRARREGALDALCASPVSSKALASAIIGAFQRRLRFLYPAIVAPYVFYVVTTVLDLWRGGYANPSHELKSLAILLPACIVIPKLMLWFFSAAGCMASVIPFRLPIQVMIVAALSLFFEAILSLFFLAAMHTPGSLALLTINVVTFGGTHLVLGWVCRERVVETVHLVWRCGE